MNLTEIPSEILLSRTVILAQKERELSLEVLQHLREIERRSLYAKRGYPSLFEYAVQELKYSQGAAHRRIASMRLLKEIPEMEEKLERGEVSLSTLARAQTFFRQEKDHVRSREEKIEILKVLENKSAREVERELVCRSSEPEKFVSERLRPVSHTHSELRVLLNAEMLRELEELRCHLSHTRPHATVRDLLEFAVRDTVTRLRPRPPRNRNRPTASPVSALETASRLGSRSRSKQTPGSKPKVAEQAALPTSELKLQSVGQVALQTPETPEPPRPQAVQYSRYIPRKIKRAVWARDEGACTYVDPFSGRHCKSKRSLEYDHIHPAALGGEANLENLRLRYRAHNQVAALEVFGHQKMAKFVPRMR